MTVSSEPRRSPEPGSIIGWREWLTLPELGISPIKAKIDTGARSSALHAFDIHYQQQDGVPMVHFKVHPRQRDSQLTLEATMPLWDKRLVRSSNGHVQERPVIKTLVHLGKQQWVIELTLTNRDVMGFRMLLGREAVRHRFLVDPGASYVLSHTANIAR